MHKFLILILLPTSGFCQNSLEQSLEKLCLCIEKYPERVLEFESFPCFEQISEEVNGFIIDSLRTAHKNDVAYLKEPALTLLAAEVFNMEIIKNCEVYYKAVLTRIDLEQLSASSITYSLMPKEETTSNIESNIDLMKSYHDRAAHHYLENEPELGFADIEKAIQIDSTSYFNYCVKGLLFIKTEDFQGAYNEYRKAYNLAQTERAPLAHRTPISIITALLWKKVYKTD